MDLKRISGAVLVAMAVVVAVHTVVEPLYYTSTEESPYSPAWGVIGWLMFVPLALGLAFGHARKRAVESGGGDGAITREFVAALRGAMGRDGRDLRRIASLRIQPPDC